ncbi:MAG: hypothetical protein R3F41_17440 [Gammaproteobacteria bacterium]|nr:hypothetical protein [Pseudomonadales bacterium]MCP5347334.1 hypothetical protein [Pseudomonadales bacterium]
MNTQSKKTQQHFEPGEGNREADRQYREQARRFVESGKVDEAARKAGRQDRKEAAEAERQGRARAKELDPTVHREHDKAVKDS